MSTAPHPSSVSLAERLGVRCGVATVVTNEQLSPSLRRLVLAHPDAVALAGVPGNDVMVRVPTADGATRRRYSVMSVDEEAATLELWVATSHEGPGSRWANAARIGDEADLVGPRGKIPLDPIADWHLFVGDVASLGSFYRLASSIEVPGRAIFIVELDNAEDAVTTTLPEGLGVTGVFVDRGDRRGGDPGALLNALAAVATPPDEGHAYLFGEFHCIRAVATALSEWGLSDEQISLKAFWRAGRDNGDNGEPPKEVA